MSSEKTSPHFVTKWGSSVFIVVLLGLVCAGACQGVEEVSAPAGGSPLQPQDPTVDSIEVTSPNGSERLVVGEVYTITWNATVTSALVKIEYSSNGGDTWSVYKTSTDNDGSELWTVPNIPSAFCLVRVSDATDGIPADTSDGPFRVEPAGSWPLIVTNTSGEVFVSFIRGQSATEAESELGFGYATSNTPPQLRHILFQGLPHHPSPTTEQSLGLLPAGSALDFYVITVDVTSGAAVSDYSGSRPNITFSDLDGSSGLGDTAVTTIAGPVEAYRLHLDRITGGYDDDDDFIVDVKIVSTTDSPPVALVQTPGGVQSGDVVISYTLKDSQSDVCTISVLFSEDGGLSWHPATAGPGGEGTANLTSTPTGQTHVFVWDSVADIGLTDQNDIRIRITPSDTTVGTPGETHNFRVNNVPPPVLSYSPDSFTFEAMEGGDDPFAQILEIWNSGGGGMDWEVAANFPWIGLNPSSGQSAGEHDQVTVSVDITGLIEGIYDGKITISCTQLPGITIEVPVRLTLRESVPVLSVLPRVLSFTTWEGGPNPPPQSLSIQNVGGQTMPWQVWEKNDMSWLDLSPGSGQSTGELDTVSVSVDATGLEIGYYWAHIVVSAPGAEGSPREIPVLLEITEPPPLLSVSPRALTLTCTEGENPVPEQILIENAGTGEFSWTFEDDADWLSVSPASGTTSDEQDSVEVSAEATALSPGTYSATVTVTATTDNSPQDVAVTLVVQEKPPTLSVSPTLLRFSAVEGAEDPPSQQVMVKNAGRGAMDWQAVTDMPWLEVSPEEGASGGEENGVEVLVHVAGLEAASYTGHVTITSAVAINSPVVVTVLLELSPPPPTLAVTPAELVFAATEGEGDPAPQAFEIRNVGSGEIVWEVSADEAWVSVSPTTGSSTDEGDIVTTEVSIEGLEPGTYTATITVTGTADNSPQTVLVRLDLAERPPAVIEVTPVSLDFATVEGEGDPDPQNLSIRNTGGRPMTWHVVSDAPWLSVVPQTDTNDGEQDVVEVTVDTSNVSPGTHWATLTVTAEEASNSPQVVQVKLYIEENPPVLVVSPLSLNFEMDEGGAAPPPQSFQISNDGGREMQWQVSASETWLGLSPTWGTNTGTPDSVQVAIGGEGLAPGTYQAGLRIEAAGAEASPQTVQVTLLVKVVEPEFLAWPEQLHFVTRRGGGDPPSQTFTLKTRFHEPIAWAAEEDAAWLSVTPSTGVNQGEEDEVTASVVKAGLDLGTYETEVWVHDVKRPDFGASVHVVLQIEPIRVPQDYPTIQEAIDAAYENDVILVSAGVYRERIQMKSDIEVLGEGPARTVIDCQESGTSVAFLNVDQATLEGFAITGGEGEYFGRGDKVGGGMYIFRSSPRIVKCDIVDNSAVWGGGVCVDEDSSPTFVNCRMTGNSAVVGGAFFFYEDSSATLLMTRVSGNIAEWYGGALFLGNLSSVHLRSCELSRNEAGNSGGALHGAAGCSVDLVSCTLADNLSPQGAAIFMEESTSLTVANTVVWGNESPMVLQGEKLFRYCDVEDEDFAGGSGNVSCDPFFVAPSDGDYHLLPCSLCIDKGSNTVVGLPGTDLEGEARIMEGTTSLRTDIGADELNPDVPIVTIEEVLPSENGLVFLKYKLWHALGAPCAILVEYSCDQGRTWHKANRASESEGTCSLSSSALGESHEFVWDSVANEGGIQAEGLLLRVTPQAVAAGRSQVGQPFSLNNTVIDSDNDLLPDTWERAIIDADFQDEIVSLEDVSGDEDFDGDGATDRSEYLAGTDPLDAQSYLKLTCSSGLSGEAIISWPSVHGRIYRVSYCDGLGNGWHALGETISGTGGRIEFKDVTAGEAVLRFYRIEVD